MTDLKNNMSKRIHLRFTEKDFGIIHKRFSASTCRSISEYGRRILLEKSITVNHRNQSLDDFMTEMIKLRNELNAIGNNLNQSVKKLHSLDHITDLKIWLISNEIIIQKILEKTDEIKLKINQFSDVWLR